MIAARGFWRPTALLLFSLSATVPTFAGDFTITGTVRAMSGAPVVGATVAVDGGPLSVTTDGAGTFRLRVPAGGHPLPASHPGFVETSQAREVTSHTESEFRLSA